MRLILSKIPLVVLGIFLGIAGPAIAASVYTAGSLLQAGDVKSIHIYDGTIVNADVSHSTAFNFNSLKVGTTTAFSKLGIWGSGTTTGTAMYIANSASTTVFTVLDNGKVGLSSTTPNNTLDINGTLGVTGTTTLRNIPYVWPGSQGASSTALMTDGAGSLSWNLPTIAVTAPTFFVGTSTTITTYTTPGGASALWIRMCGAGGSGGSYNTTNGSTGGNSEFGTGTASTTAVGGGGGNMGGGSHKGGVGGGGGATGLGTEIFRNVGSGGSGGTNATASGGGIGGSSPFGGAAGAALVNGSNNGSVAAGLNSCSGGGGAAFGAVGGGGGAGEYVEFIINSPASTYKYDVGAAGSGGGGNGGTGLVIVQALYH